MKMLTFIPMFASKFIGSTFILQLIFWVLLACVIGENTFYHPKFQL